MKERLNSSTVAGIMSSDKVNQSGASRFVLSARTAITDTSGTRAQGTYADPSGTTVTTASAPRGERPAFETHDYPKGTELHARIDYGADHKVEEATKGEAGAAELLE